MAERVASALVLLIAAVLAAAAAGRQPGPPPAPEPAAPDPGPEERRPDDGEADASPRVRLLKPGGGRLDWSVQGDAIAFDRRGSDGFYDLWVMRPDGGGEECLTCTLLELRKAHALDPAWHPSGRYLVFQVQEHAAELDISTAGLTSPDRGLHAELWVIARGSRRPWRLTDVGQRGGAVLGPRFSHEGGRLAWSERVSTRGGRWGRWVVRAGRFGLRAGVPTLSKVETYKPGRQRGLLTVSAFSPDDRKLLLAGEIDAGDGETGLDLYLLELDGGGLTPLLRSPGEWDESARFAPGGEGFAWASSRELAGRPLPDQRGGMPTARPIPRDLWWMPGDGAGSAARRLTSFNRPGGSPGGAVVSDLAWNPEGGVLAVHAVTDLAAGEEGIYLVEPLP